jgi:hypothetical protein
MKKFLTILICVVTIVACALSMAGCSLFVPKPEKDLETAKTNLEEAEYEVDYEVYSATTDIMNNDGIEEYLSASKDVENGEDIELSVYICASTALAKAYYKQLKTMLGNQKDMVKAYIAQIEAMLDEYEYSLSETDKKQLHDDLADYKETLEEYNDVVYGRSGNMVWVGHKEAIKASKGE